MPDKKSGYSFLSTLKRQQILALLQQSTVFGQEQRLAVHRACHGWYATVLLGWGSGVPRLSNTSDRRDVHAAFIEAIPWM